MLDKTVTDGWIGSWQHSSTLLFCLVPEDEIEGMEDCGALLSRLRESRLQLSEAPPDPRLAFLARNVLDDLWKAATLSLYGDLIPARACIASARRRAHEIQALIAEP